MRSYQTSIVLGANPNLLLTANPNRRALLLTQPTAGVFQYGFVQPGATNTPGFVLGVNSGALLLRYDDLGDVIKEPLWVWATSAGQIVTLIEMTD